MTIASTESSTAARAAEERRLADVFDRDAAQLRTARELAACIRLIANSTAAVFDSGAGYGSLRDLADELGNALERAQLKAADYVQGHRVRARVLDKQAADARHAVELEQAAAGLEILHRLEPVAGKPGSRRDPETGATYYSSEWLQHDEPLTVRDRVDAGELGAGALLTPQAVAERETRA